MLKVIFYAVLLLCAMCAKVFGQETFTSKARSIAQEIESITKEEKEALKEDLEKINEMLDNGEITKEEAEAQKFEIANFRAGNIEKRVAEQEALLTQLVQEQVDGKYRSEKDTTKVRTKTITWSCCGGGKKTSYGERRTTSQFVFALGLNNLLDDGELSSLEDSDFRVWGSRFYEWGVTWNTRIMKNHNLLHAKYGVSLQYNNLRPTNNRYFVKDGNQTMLQTADIDFRESRLRNVNLVFPVHLEFDFTPKKVDEEGRAKFYTHNSFRIGIGGYAGFNVKTKQILRYKEDDINVKIRERGDFNTSDFIYGLSAYAGYRTVSLYVKYDMNPLFKNNPVDQNNVSLGLRFDFN